MPHVDSTAVPPDAQRLITLTTCHPQFSDAERMIIHGVLVRELREVARLPAARARRRAEPCTPGSGGTCPGPTAARAAQALLLFLVVVALLFFVVFPWLEPYLPFDRVDQRLHRRRVGAGRPDNRASAPAGPCATLVGVTTILVVDNYDSFVFNLVQYLEQLGAECIVRRNDAVTTDEVDGPRGRRRAALARARAPRPTPA